MSSPSPHDTVPRVAAPSPVFVIPVAQSPTHNDKNELYGSFSPETVRVFNPDEAIQKQPPTSSPAPNPLKSSLKHGILTNGIPISSPKSEERSPRDSGRATFSTPKANPSAQSLSADSRRVRHQRFPSTGLSLPSSASPVLDVKVPYNEKRTSSQQYYPKSGHAAHAAANGLHGNNVNSPGHLTSSSKGHRRQPSIGREQRQVNYCPYDGYSFVLDETRCAICMEERGSLPAPARGNGLSWKKVLYEKQGFEDNYTDRDTFLAELKKNVNVQEYSYRLVMADSLIVTQQLSIVVLFVTVFMHTLNGTINGNQIGILDIAIALGGYILWALCQPSDLHNSSKTHILNFTSILQLIGYSVGLYVISPVLAALTDPISDDTIATLSIILLLIHLSFQDYGYLNIESEKPTPAIEATPTAAKVAKASSREGEGHVGPRARRGSYTEVVGANSPSILYHAPVSLNAAIFASLLMASRLSTHSHAFVIIAFAVELFALFPIMAHHVKRKSRLLSLILVVGLFSVSLALLHPLSRVLTYIYASTIAFTTFISPFCLQWIQRYKNEIHGPWDEAVPARARRHGTRQ